MSLDVSLVLPGNTQPTIGSGIFVREDGATKEITREEWDALHPGEEPVIAIPDEAEVDTVYTRNITHNLTTMAKKAGIYKTMWHPEDIGANKAKDICPLLADGLRRLLSEPDKFKEFNPENGWGDYDGLVDFVFDYSRACGRYPEATIEICR